MGLSGYKIVQVLQHNCMMVYYNMYTFSIFDTCSIELESAHKNDTCAYGKIKNQIGWIAPYTLQKLPGSFEKRTKYCCWNGPSTSCQKQLASWVLQKGSLSLEGSPSILQKKLGCLKTRSLSLGGPSTC